jgi:predicted anti-sigma-YlaC factor YlaD
MNSDSHERARMLIALSDPSEERLASADQSWLQTHLDSCPACREFRENSREAVHALRGISIAADSRLVSATQMRVRQRALELQRHQERFWVICACVATVTFCSAVSTALLWRGFAWLGQQAQLQAPVWEGGFVVFYLTPAVLAGILLLAQGTFLAEHDGPNKD